MPIRPTTTRIVVSLCCLLTPAVAAAAVAGAKGQNDLVIASSGSSPATVVVSSQAGKWEKQAATDLVKYIALMSGGRPKLADTAETAKAALKSKAPVLLVGQAALAARPELRAALQEAAKPKPTLRSDAIVVRREGARVYLAGLNDECHYYAVSYLLTQWGCRWYLPTEFGECVPEQRELAIGELNHAYGSPFEVRRYWISWLGDTTGRDEFMRRNMMNEVMVPNGHILAKYTKDLAPKGKTHWNVPITDDKTAQHVADQVAPIYAAGKDVQLGMEDGLYASDSPLDKELIDLQYDKYFMTQSVSDAFLVFYNKVAGRLMRRYPQSKARIGFLAYANMTIPPVRDITAKPPLVAYLAPIDIDPIHPMNSPLSAPRRELKDIVRGWAKVMQGRVVIYDYDQGMLVWRDIPAPSLQMFRHDVQAFRQAGILGVDTESRNAIATIFTNLFFRGQLLWNPDADVDAMQAEFYEKFYGPAAKPMAAYWTAINNAWAETIVTEHEYFVIPAIYTPKLVRTLRSQMTAAEGAVAALKKKSPLSRNERLYIQRLEFTRLSFSVIDAYTRMARAAASEADYRKAVSAGEQGLATREKLTEMNGTFTTYKRYPERGAAWWPGEVEQYRQLLKRTDGTDGELILKLPLEWAFRRDPQDVGVQKNWVAAPVDLAYWNALPRRGDVASHQNNPGHWETLRSDLYLQAQGVITKDHESYTGHAWYRAGMELSAKQTAGAVHLMFPGLFNECWLYVNGKQVAHREQHPIWWRNSYAFEWDVDLQGKLHAGTNTIALRIDNPHHFGGMFRRPFLYRAK